MRWRKETASASYLLDEENVYGLEVRPSQPDNAHQLYQQLHAEWPQLKTSLEMVKTKVSTSSTSTQTQPTC